MSRGRELEEEDFSSLVLIRYCLTRWSVGRDAVEALTCCFRGLGGIEERRSRSRLREVKVSGAIGKNKNQSAAEQLNSHFSVRSVEDGFHVREGESIPNPRKREKARVRHRWRAAAAARGEGD